MANTQSQAQQIKELLIERMEAFDPTLNVAQGSTFYSQVVEPIFAAMGVDPFDTDIEEFLLSRLRQEFPTIPAEEGDAVVDLLIRPLQLLLESFKRELQIIRTGQSTNYADQMRLSDAEDLAANFFVRRRTGGRASGVVRMYFRQPTFVSVLATTQFRTSDGLIFFPTVPQFFRPEVVAVQRSGDLYYVDVTAIAEDYGEEYNIPENTISVINGVSSVSRVTNLFAFGGGSDEETGAELLNRTQLSLTERSLVTRRGIRARLFDEFTSIRNMEVVGYGDPEMQRDKITGGGGMDNICSGMCFIVGRYAMLFSMFEDRGPDEDRFIKEGGVLDLNFWKFLYEPTREQAMQRFTVETVIYNSNGDLENIPTVYLVKLDDAPDIEEPVASSLPGVLPGVFFTAYAPATITISNIPGGITNPDDEGRILVEDGSVHIGGHYDVYLRPSQSNTDTVTADIERSEVALFEGTELVTNGEIPTELSLLGALKNKVHSRLRLNIVVSAGAFAEGELVRKQDPSSSTPEEDTTALLLNYDLSDRICDLACLTSDTGWAEGDYVIGLTTGAVGVITSIESTNWEDLGVAKGMTLHIINGSDTGIYKILDVRGVELVLDLELTTLGSGFQFRITDETVFDAFSPKSQVFPFGEETANDLNTVIGSATVKVDRDLSLFGVKSGDTLEILTGDNKGTYIIQGFDSVVGSTAPVLDRALRATDSDLEYVVYRTTFGLNLPLVRIAPNGMSVLDSSGQSSGFTIPPSEPVGARAYQAFSGAKASYLGLNGFVLPDPGPSWMPNGNTVVDLDNLASIVDSSGTTALEYIQQYYGEPGRCYSSECHDYEDAFIAVISIVDNPSTSGGADIRIHLDLDLPTDATDFLQNLRAWLVSIVESFELGDDFRSLIDLFAPVSLDDVDTASWNIIAQYEVLIPQEIFDGCNNVFVAIPEYNWTNEFGNDTTFQLAMDKYNNGELRGGKPALTRAEPGGVLSILSGANAGSYVISKVYRYSLVNGAAIQTDGSGEYINKDKMFEVALVCIDDAFPVEPFKGLAQYFDATLGSAVSLPIPPSFEVQSIVTAGADAGTVLGPWEVVQQAVTWLFQFLNSTGFTLPEEFTVAPDSVLKKLTQTFFVDYVVGHTTCEQMVRMSFLEPTSVTVYGNRPCFNYTWYETDTEPASIRGGAITLPMTMLSGETFSLNLSGLGTKETISAELSASLSTEEDPATFVSLLQSEVDADAKKIIFTYEQVGDHTLVLTVTSVEEGVDVKIFGDADQATDTARILGFTESGAPVPEMALNENLTDFQVAEIAQGDGQVDLQVQLTSGEYSRLNFSTSLSGIGSPEVGDTVTQGSDTRTIVGFLGSPTACSLLLEGGSALSASPVDINGTSYSPSGRSDSQFTFYLSGASVAEHEPPHTSFYVGTFSDGAFYTTPGLLFPCDFSGVDARTTKFSDAISSASSSISGLGELLKEIWADSLFNNTSPLFPAYVRGDSDYTYVLPAIAELEIGEDTSDPSQIAVSYTSAIYLSSTTVRMVKSSGSPSSRFMPETSFTDLLDGVSTKFTVFDEVSDFVIAGEDHAGNAWGYSPTTPTEVDELLDAVQLFDSSGDYDVEAIAAALNQHESLSLRASDSQRVVLFYVPVLDDASDFATIGTSPTVSLRFIEDTVEDSDHLTPGASLFNVSDYARTTRRLIEYPILGVGTSSTGESHTEYVHPTAPTLFSAEAGAAELLFVATGTEAPFQVFPGETENGRVLPLRLYRDLNISTHFDGALGFTATFSEPAYASPLVAGVNSGTDILRVFEQRTLIEVAGSGAEPLPEKFDRVVAVTTTFGSAVISLPKITTGSSTEFGFLSSTTDLERDEVVPGDLLFIEEGDDARGYIVQSVSDTQITLDRALTTTTDHIYQAGNEGVIDQGTAFYDMEASFTADDVGRYLTIFLSNYEGVDGSYQITAVTDSNTVELDLAADFPVSEVGVHWAVVKAPVDDLESSEIDGAIALHGVVPIRIYNSIPTEWRIASFRPTVDRASANLLCTYAGGAYRADNPHTRDLSEGPIRGYKQPYEIIREKVVHISSTAMKSQGRDNGLYYFDVRAKSLGGDAVYNIPKDAQMTPIFGTFDSDGYRLEVADPLFSFSMKEHDTKIHLSPRFLPAGLNDTEDNKISLENTTLSIEHDYSGLVAGVQSVLLSADNRVLCADPLARHFLPSYVYFDVTASGGSSSAMGLAIADYIDGLEPEDVLDVSILEKYLHQNDVTSYRHPLTLQIVTHDLDRKAVLTRSNDRIGEESDEAAFNGTHRTTFYIAGNVETSAQESDIPDGERIYIKRSE